MKTTLIRAAGQNCANRIPIGLVLAIAVVCLRHDASAVPINLGTAANFAILGGSAVTFAVANNTVTGDVGVYPGTSITGTDTLVLTGSSAIQLDPGALLQAQNDATAAYGVAAAAPVPLGNTILNELAGQSLVPGVYDFTTGGTVFLNGTLNLSGSGVFVFKVPAALVTGSSSVVNLAADVIPCNVIWQVTSSATLGSHSAFVGTILALKAITLAEDVNVHGRLLAQTELVSLINDTIINAGCQPGANLDTDNPDHPSHLPVPDAGSTLLLLSSGLGTLFAFRRRFFSPA